MITIKKKIEVEKKNSSTIVQDMFYAKSRPLRVCAFVNPKSITIVCLPYEMHSNIRKTHYKFYAV